MAILIEKGMSLEDLIDEFGDELASESVFEVECECGEVYDLEPDGSCTCDECGLIVSSPLLKYGLI